MRIFLSTLLLALCSLPAFCADLDALYRTSWVQAESKHFRVVTDESTDTASRMVADLERMRHFSLRALGVDALETVTPLTVLAVGDAKFFVKVGLSENYEGIFNSSLRGHAAMANVLGYIGDGDTPTTARATLLHEYHHFLVRMTQQTVAYPLWCTEGMAEYFSTLRYNNTSVSVGDLDGLQHRIRGLYDAKGRINIDTAKLFNTTKLDFLKTDRSNKEELSRFYSRAGFVIHYFNSSPELRAQLAQYLRLYNLGIGQDRAARLAFKRSYEDLDSYISQYVRHNLSARVFTTTEGPFMFPPVEIRAGVLDQPRVAAALAFVLTRVAVPRDTIDAAVAKNLQYNPASADANIDQLIFSPKGYNGAALVALSQRFPGNAQVLAMLGEAILGNAEALRASGLPGWQALLLQARAQFRLAVKADPGYPATYSGLGRVYLSLPDSEPLEEGITGFDTASIYLRTPAIFRGLAALALRSNHPEEGLTALRNAVIFANDGGYSEDALLLDNLELLNDVRNAKPTLTPDGLAYKNGSRYVGGVNGLKPDGGGKLERVNGSYFEGTFRGGLPLTGKLVSERGGEYEGQFSAGVASGQGTLRYPRGAAAGSYVGAAAASYVGDVALGKPAGHGVLTGPTGRYEGEFLNGEPHGGGSFTPKFKPVAMRGKWLYGRYVWPVADGEVFVGAIDTHGRASGAGYCYAAATNNGLRNCQRGNEPAKLATSDD